MSNNDDIRKGGIPLRKPGGTPLERSKTAVPESNTDEEKQDSIQHDFHALLDATWETPETVIAASKHPSHKEIIEDEEQWEDDEAGAEYEVEYDYDSDFDMDDDPGIIVDVNADLIEDSINEDDDESYTNEEFEEYENNHSSSRVENVENGFNDNESISETSNIVLSSQPTSNTDLDKDEDEDEDEDDEDNITSPMDYFAILDDTFAHPDSAPEVKKRIIYPARKKNTNGNENDNQPKNTEASTYTSSSVFASYDDDDSVWGFGDDTPEKEYTSNSSNEESSIPGTNQDSSDDDYNDEFAEYEPEPEKIDGVDGVYTHGKGIISAKGGDAPVARVPVRIGKRGKPLKPKRNNHDYKVRLTDRDMSILNFLARYRYATYPQLAAYCGTSEVALRRRMPRLKEKGLILSDKGGPSWLNLWMVSETGMKLTGLDLAVPRVSWGTVAHTLGLVDLGVKFELDDELVVTEREIRAADTRAKFSDRMTYATNLNRGSRRDGPLTSEDGSLYVIPLAGNKMGHIPDMMLVRKPTETGEPRNIAVELELVRKPMNVWKNILLAYARAPHIAQVRYYTHKKEIATAIAKIAAENGLVNGEVQVKRFDFTVPGLAN